MKYQYTLLTVAFLMVSVSPIYGQQEPYLSHFAFNRVNFNAAAAGASGGICVNMVNHRQWLQLPDQTGLFKTESGIPVLSKIPTAIAPVTNMVSISAPFTFKADKDYGGFFAEAGSDVVAYEKNTFLKLGVAAAIPLSEQTTLRAGIDATNFTKQFNTAALRPLVSNDPMIPYGPNPSSSRWLIGAGLYLKAEAFHQLRAGISVSQLNNSVFEYASPSGSTKINTARHFYMSASMTFDQFFGSPLLSFEPNFMLRTVNDGNGWVRPQSDIQGLVNWYGKVALGPGVRFQGYGSDAAYLMLGLYPLALMNKSTIHPQSLRIGFAYDFTLQSLRLNSRNTMEVQVNYCIRFSSTELHVNHPLEVRPHRNAYANKPLTLPHFSD